MATTSYKAGFSRFLGTRPGRLHCAAHSHHPWPDATWAAQQQAWQDAAELMDSKWDKVFGEVIPTAQSHVSRLLRLPDPATVCFAQNTHDFLVRLLSCIEPRPFRVLTTDGEFHSFSRQINRLEEAGVCSVMRVPVEPFDNFQDRFSEAAGAGGHQLVFFSQVFFNSGFVLTDLAGLVGAVRDADTLVVVDGYHGFMALPTDVSAIAHRAFYLAGGYKYAMSGEGAALMHCPPGYGPRPRVTGWLAGFGALAGPRDDGVAYAEDGSRFMGATFDPSGLYRFNAAMDWLSGQGLTPQTIHGHVEALQNHFLDRLDTLWLKALNRAYLIPRPPLPRGHFLTFRHPQARELCRRLLQLNVVTDYREDRLRIGFGIYHDQSDIPELIGRINAVKM